VPKINKNEHMKKLFICLLIIFTSICVHAQCSMCTKTASQLGEKPAQGLNSGILYLMFTPFIIVGVIAYKWWKNNKATEETETTTSI
jgi:glycopeptide antibiotics resistance protein